MDVWKEALKRGAQLDENNVIYKGVKFVKTEHGIDIYTTETDFYEDMDPYIVDLFHREGFDIAINTYLHSKYCRQIERLNFQIMEEVSGRKNNRKYNYLKKLRDQTIEKISYARDNRKT